MRIGVAAFVSSFVMPLASQTPVHGELQILKHFVDFARLLGWCHA
jgi:hypothetical protein